MTGVKEFKLLVRVFDVSVGFEFGWLTFSVFGLLFVLFLGLAARRLTLLGRSRDRLCQREIRRRLSEVMMFVSRQDMFCIEHPVYRIKESVLYFGSDPVLERDGQYVKPLVSQTDVIMDMLAWHGIGKQEAQSLFWIDEKRSGAGFLKRIEGVCDHYKDHPSPGYLETNDNGVNFFVTK